MPKAYPPNQAFIVLLILTTGIVVMGYDIATHFLFPPTIGNFFLAIWGFFFWLFMVGTISDRFPEESWEPREFDE